MAGYDYMTKSTADYMHSTTKIPHIIICFSRPARLTSFKIKTKGPPWTNFYTHSITKKRSHTHAFFAVPAPLLSACLPAPGAKKTKNPLGPKSAFAVRPECAWVINGVEDSGSGKRTGGTSIVSSSATVLEGTAMRQLRR